MPELKASSKNKLADAWHSLVRDLRTIRRFFRMARLLTPSCIWLTICVAFVSSVMPFINVIAPKLIIDELLGEQRIERFILLVVCAVSINTIFTFAATYIERRLRAACLDLQEKCKIYLGNRIMHRDYEDLEDPELLDTKNQAVLPLLQGGIWGFYSVVTRLITGLVTMAGLTALIATLNIGVILLILLMVSVNMMLFQKSQAMHYDMEKKLSVLRREWDYYEDLTGNFTVGKDVRLYGIQGLISGKMDSLLGKMRGTTEDIQKKCAHLDGLTRANGQLQMVLVYVYLTYQVLYKALGIGNFTMYASAASAFSGSLTNFFENLIWGRQIIHRAEPFLDFVENKPRKSKEGKSTEGITCCDIAFHGVSFRYPRGTTDILKDISIRIPAGEKLSVVGLNGAGKTTFIKLLTRLYDPNSGKITVNGTDIREFGYQEYLKLLAVVFQDFRTLSLSIRDNIALENAETASDADIENALEKAGLAEAVRALPKGMDTMLYKIFDEEGIEFSGGQNQKLAIARAVYKNAPIVVLDEPTAALDPLSEYEIYNRLNSLIGDKTAIYISHHLSSCRFCNRIIVFADGKITQCGTHDELMRDTGGQYYKMYTAQAQHYA